MQKRTHSSEVCAGGCTTAGAEAGKMYRAPSRAADEALGLGYCLRAELMDTLGPADKNYGIMVGAKFFFKEKSASFGGRLMPRVVNCTINWAGFWVA